MRRMTDTPCMQTLKGFTLVELMIGLALAAIVLSVGVPSLRATIENNELVTQTNDFVTSLNLARSESVRRGARVALCKSDDSVDCGAADYASGWIVFVDLDNSGDRDVNTEDLISVSPALSSVYSLQANTAFNNFIGFLPSGGSHANGEFVLCKDNDITKARAINILASGRINTRSDAITACTP